MTRQLEWRRAVRRVLGCVGIAAGILSMVAVAEVARIPVVAEAEKVIISRIEGAVGIPTPQPKITDTAVVDAKAKAAAKAQADAQAQAAADAATQQAQARAAEVAAQQQAQAQQQAAPSHSFNVVMGSADRDTLQAQVFASTEPVDASAFYGTPWIVWDRTKGGLAFPQDAGAVVHFTGAISGTYRVDGVLQYVGSDTPITQLARGTSLTFQVCDAVYGHDHMHIVGLTRIA